MLMDATDYALWVRRMSEELAQAEIAREAAEILGDKDEWLSAVFSEAAIHPLLWNHERLRT
jgi:hypothetical protein